MLLLDYRAIGLSPNSEDIVIFFVDLLHYGVLDPASLRLLGYLADGCSTAEIADHLAVSPRSANRQIARLRATLESYFLPTP